MKPMVYIRGEWFIIETDRDGQKLAAGAIQSIFRKEDYLAEGR